MPGRSSSTNVLLTLTSKCRSSLHQYMSEAENAVRAREVGTCAILARYE